MMRARMPNSSRTIADATAEAISAAKVIEKLPVVSSASAVIVTGAPMTPVPKAAMPVSAARSGSSWRSGHSSQPPSW